MKRCVQGVGGPLMVWLPLVIVICVIGDYKGKSMSNNLVK